MRALEHTCYARTTYVDLDLPGVPGVVNVGVFAQPIPAGRPSRVGIDVVRVNDRLLKHIFSTVLELGEHERPETTDPTMEVVISADDLAPAEGGTPTVVSVGEVEWYRCTHGRIVREVCSLNRRGEPLFHDVDTSIRNYKMVCPECGRLRYATGSALRLIQRCRVCQHQERARQQRLNQYRRRARRGTPRALAPHLIDLIVQLHEAGRKQVEIACDLRITPSCVSKVLKRHRSR